MAEKTERAKTSKAAEKDKPTTDRDMTLIRVLERMADQIQRQDELLDGILKRQADYNREATNIEFQRSLQQSESDTALRQHTDSLSRYRSDMLSLVNEQDVMNKNMKELQKLVSSATFAAELTTERVAVLEELLKTQEKEIHDHFEHSLKQAETLPQEFASTSQNYAQLHAETEKSLEKMHAETQSQLEGFAKLHADTEKSIENMHAETQKQLEGFTKLHADTEKSIENMHAETQKQLEGFTKLHADTEQHISKMHAETQRNLERMQHDTLKRLMSLDDMESVLQTLLIRSEPPEKKAPLPVRVYYAVVDFFKVKLPVIFKKFWRFLTKPRRVRR